MKPRSVRYWMPFSGFLQDSTHQVRVSSDTYKDFGRLMSFKVGSFVFQSGELVDIYTETSICTRLHLNRAESQKKQHSSQGFNQGDVIFMLL